MYLQSELHIAIGVSTWHSSGIALLRLPVVVTEGHDVTNLESFEEMAEPRTHGPMRAARSSPVFVMRSFAVTYLANKMSVHIST